MLSATLASPAATGRLGRVLAARLAPPALVTLRGELGTGKTTLVRHMLRACGVKGVVVSPSFTIAQSYTGRHGLRLHHLDLYRLAPGADVELFAWDDYLGPDVITFVEWPEAGDGVLPAQTVRLTLYHETPNSRRVAMIATPAVETAVAAALEAAGVACQVIDERAAPGGPAAVPR
jgi:tRNA threonylcarbamoyl adenosine modification protein YjeE